MNAETVLLLDRYQHHNNPDAIACPQNGHGLLTAHKSGSVLMCATANCEAHIRVDSELIEKATVYNEATRYGADFSKLAAV